MSTWLRLAFAAFAVLAGMSAVIVGILLVQRVLA
jgi:hypothetical protein